MKEIKPTYVTFEQAKWLKEKGFNIECRNYYDNSGEFCEVSNRFTKNMNSLQTAFLEIAVFPEDADFIIEGFIVYSAPEQWQVVEWLRINHGIWINIGYSGDKTVYMMTTNLNGDVLWNEKGFNSPQEAYSAAFDYILKNLI